jgi:hypothetical protein
MLGNCELGFTPDEFWQFKFEKMKWLFVSSQVLPPCSSFWKPAPLHISDFFIGFLLEEVVKVSPSNLSKNQSLPTFQPWEAFKPQICKEFFLDFFVANKIYCTNKIEVNQPEKKVCWKDILFRNFSASLYIYQVQCNT